MRVSSLSQTFSHLTPLVLVNINEFGFFLAINYILCYFITSLTEHGLAFADITYDLHWYELARKEQFVVLMILRRAQDRFELKGLGVLTYSLATYAKVRFSMGVECTNILFEFKNQKYKQLPKKSL